MQKRGSFRFIAKNESLALLYLTNPAQIPEPRTLFTDNMWVWIVGHAALSLHEFTQKCLPKASNWGKCLHPLSLTQLHVANLLQTHCNQFAQ